jgi:cytochrome c556
MIKSVRVLLATFVLVLFASAVHAQNPAIGSWDLTTISPEGEFKSTLVVREEGGTLKAFGKSPQGERPYDSVNVEGSKITLVVTISYNGTPMVITYSGTIDKTKMGGEADYGGLATGTWSATAQKQ